MPRKLKTGIVAAGGIVGLVAGKVLAKLGLRPMGQMFLKKVAECCCRFPG